MNRLVTTITGAAFAAVALSACGGNGSGSAADPAGTTPSSPVSTPSSPASTPAGTPAGTPSTTPTSTTPTSTTPTSAPTPTVVDYPGDGVEVVKAADARKLTGTTDAFRAFVAAAARRAAADSTPCPDAFHGVTVQKYSSAGYAIGGINTCGGYEALWVLRDGTWAEGQATQDAWDCDALVYLGVPRSFSGRCYNESGGFGEPGGGLPEPGMTRAQATAGGVVITSDAAAPPCTATHLALPQVPTGDAGNGLFSPTDGLVVVTMTSDAKTVKGVGLGTPRAKVLKAYPGARDGGGGVLTVPRPHGTSFVIHLGSDGRVEAFTWQLDKADCQDYMM